MDSEAITLRLRKEVIAQIDGWRRDQSDLPGRPEAIRRLVGISLNNSEIPAGILPGDVAMLDRYIEEERPGCSREEALQIIAQVFLHMREHKKRG